ncbi:lymphocyte-specific protein 1 isoform X2 [Eptesicus fuscus]|uniref:lymphocyte-specific protein 1 isoform X2 n=1 Tax=Eptesicus fuscus TaxID=29078 RepID=UPI00240453AA|nr:lymphocyte-specific protein 1 isoform X2 [Eptesicus fuscus]
MSSSAVLRRSPSKQGLDTLLRLATQWSLEDEEEAARERRRRERDRHRRAQDQDGGSPTPEPPEQEKLLQAPEAPELEEDEGFGDWAQKSELRQPLQGESPEGEQEEARSRLPSGGPGPGSASCPPPAPGPRVPHLPLPCGPQDGDELCPARVCLEELHLNPNSEPQEGPGPEQAEPVGPEETGRGSPGPAEAEEAEEMFRFQHQQCQRPRAPSPLLLEETTEPSSPPLSPSTKLIDRTESLSRSIKKSNSVKRSQPALPISKIDDRLEQYTQAIETAGRNAKLARQPSIELPSMAVASTKSRWETGEVQAQSATKSPSCKDIVAGDMSKKSLWEQEGGSKTSSTIKSTPSGKRYKFVATGHGKYEKVLMDEGSGP